MRKIIGVIAGMFATVAAAQAAFNPSNVPHVPTIAALQNLGTTSPQYGTVIVDDVTRGGTFTWQSSSLPCNAISGGGDAGATFCASNGSGGFLTSGYWRRQYNGALHTGWFNDGVKDIGAQINAAYASSPGFGGEIDIDPSPNGLPYSFTTPITETTVGKCPVIRGLGASGPDASANNSGPTVLNYTPTSGAAWTIDCQTLLNNNLINVPFQNVTLLNNGCVTTGGCGSSAIGIEVGTTNAGDMSFAYQNLTVQGFGTGYQNLNQNGINCCEQFNNLYFLYNGIALDSDMQGGEFFGGFIAANGKAWTVSNAALTKTPGLNFHGVIFVDNVTPPIFDVHALSIYSNLYFSDSHLENASGLDCNYISGKLFLVMINGEMEDDSTSGTCAKFITAADTSVVTVLGTTLTAGRTVSTVVDATNFVTASVYPTVTSPGTIATMVSGTNVAFSNFCAIAPTFTPATCQIGNPMTYQGLQTFKGGINVPALPTSCSGQPSKTLWNNSNVVNVCP